MKNQSSAMQLDDIRSDDYKEKQAAAYKNDLVRLHARLNEFVNVKCPACDADEAVFRFDKYRCRFVECQACSTLYMSPRPTPEIMNEYYNNSENYAIWNKYIFPKSEDARRDKICKPNLDHLITVCERNAMVRPSLLEIGPGFGTFAALAKKEDYFGRITVVERTPEMANACRSKGLEVIDSSLEDIGSKYSIQADVAVCFEVIEHIFDPMEFLVGISHLMRPGGVLLFTCPNGQGFDTIMLESASPAVDSEHVNLFNTKSIHLLLERAGFSVESIETPGRLDVELVRRGVLDGDFKVDHRSFFHKLLIEDFEKLAEPFQRFLGDNALSGNMRVTARKVDLA